MCPPPVPTYFLSLFVKLLMTLLMDSRGKSFHINSNATFNSLVFGFDCKLWYFSSIAPTNIIPSTRFKSGEFGCHWSFSMKPGQLTIEPILRKKSTFALVRRLAERWIQLAADAFNLKLILEAGDQRNMQHPPSPIHEQTQSTFATQTNTSRYRSMWSELVAFNDQVIRSDSDMQLCWYPAFVCVDTGGGHIEHKLWSNIKCVWLQLFEIWLNKIVLCCFLLRYKFLNHQKTGGGLKWYNFCSICNVLVKFGHHT